MGTTYHVQVEVLFTKPEYSVEQWQSVSRWELQKDYGFGRSFRTIAHPGWPKDMDNLIGEDDDQDIIEKKFYADGSAFAALKSTYNDDEEVDWFIWAQELQYHVKRLIGVHTVRLIYWEE